MNRKQRRDLRKDKDLIRELYSIISKYFPNLLNMFDNLTDTRHQSYITYSMKTICITRLFPLLCGITTMTEISADTFNTDACIKNISKICKQNLKELPYWETIQDVFMNIKINELRNIQKYIVKTLIRSKMFNKYKHDGYFQIVVDGTGLSSHNYNLNNNCIKRKYKDGKVAYCKYVLECKLVVGNIVISLDSEWIENSESLNEKQKQDCETKAFERMVVRIKKNYPKQKFILTADALYCTSSVMNICKQNNWKYIFNLNDRLRTVFKDFNDYIEVTTNNIREVVSLGRNRWKIENQGFYNQKHRTFDISHLNSRNDVALKNHYLFIQIAHTIRQLLEQGNKQVKLLKLKIKEVSSFLLSNLTSTISDLNNLETKFQLRFDD